MSGDYTRLTFDAIKAFRGVRKQQGRVSLDSDFNEFGDILDRHSRSEMYDTVGQAVVPITTPDGFKIDVAAGKLTIGVGRAYVDGLQAECFGDLTKLVRDDTLGGVYGSAAVAYDKQPFYYQPNFPALSTAAGKTDLVYLDVWKREVTVFEDGALRDPALGGPDTATRMQTAWQVKILRDVAASSCVVPPASWAALIAPSTGQLTATATPAAPSPGPCVIEPLGGYTGLENRLYRVEIHRGGTVDGLPGTTALFKWSRDDASLAASVSGITSVSPTESIITVVSTGRDAWMRFAFQDYVELLDDQVEFAMRERDIGGQIARILSVNHATGEIHVDRDLSGFFQAGQHARIKRWDTATPLDPALRNTNAGTAIPLEEGITVTFGPAAGDKLRAGDFWVFAARTADGSIDTLTAAPPLGILHHFAELALVTTGTPPVVINDCRKFWPPASCCTVVVRPGESIQHAIDSLNGAGGCVCLKMGIHKISAPILIDQDNLTLHGEAPWVKVQMTGTAGLPLLEIGSVRAVNRVTVEGISFESPTGTLNGPMLQASQLTGGHVSRCQFTVGSTGTVLPGSVGIKFDRCHDYAVEHSAFVGLMRGIWATASDDIGVSDNSFAGPVQTSGPAQNSAGTQGIEFGNMGATPVPPTNIYVERNALSDYLSGILIGADLPQPPRGPVEGGCRIADNTISRRGGASGVLPLWAIACHASHAEIAGNAMNLSDALHNGVFVTGSNMTVAGNEITSSVVASGQLPLPRIPVGVYAFVREGLAVVCTIRGNLFTGLQRAINATGVDTAAPLHLRGNRIDIVENRIQADPGLFGLAVSAIANASAPPLGAIGGTALLLSQTEGLASILVQTAAHSRVAANEISGAVCGILVLGGLGVTVVENRTFGCLIGISCEVVLGCEVNDNIIENGLVLDSPQASAATVGIAILLAARCTAERNVANLYGIGMLSLLTVADRLSDNRLYNGDTGIFSLLDTDAEINDNTVEDVSTTGILSAFAMHEIALSRNRTLRCGYHEGDLPAFGILLFFVAGLAIVDSCHVIDTGESPVPNAAVFNKPRYGIAVLGAIGARVRDCNIVSKPLVPVAGTPTQPASIAGLNDFSRALLMYSFANSSFTAGEATDNSGLTPFADATDNVIGQSVRHLVEIFCYGDTMFATNRCTNYARGLPPLQVLTDNWAVRLSAVYLVVTGNRVDAEVRKFTSLLMEPYTALSAVGNMCSGGETVNPATGIIITPTPHTNYNAIV